MQDSDPVTPPRRRAPLRLRLKRLFFRYIKFGSIASVGNLVNIGVLFVLTEWLNMDYRIAGFIAIEARIIHNFFINYFWTWRDRRGEPIRRKLVMLAQFHASTLLMGIIFNWLVLVGVTEFFGLNPNLSNLIAILVGNIGAVLNFLFSHRVTFRRKRHETNGDHSPDAGAGLAS